MKKLVLLVLAVSLLSCDEGNQMSVTSGTEPTSLGRISQVLVPGVVPATPINIGVAVDLLRFVSRKQDTPEMITGTLTPLCSGARGPIVGILSWASGSSGKQSIEFDIPVSPIGPASQTPAFGGGTIFCVTGTSLDLAVRNDAAFTPRVGDDALGTDTPATLGLPQVSAIIGVGTKSSAGGLTRTLWMVKNAGGGLAPAGVIAAFPIAKFARTVIVQRASAAQTISVTFNDVTGAAIDGPYNVAANVRCPELNIPGNAFSITVTNTGAANITQLSALYSLSL